MGPESLHRVRKYGCEYIKLDSIGLWIRRGRDIEESTYIAVIEIFLTNCSNPLRINEVVDVAIEVPLLNKPLITEAEVVWTNICGPDDKITPRGMVVRYKNLDSGVRNRLLQVIEIKENKQPHTQDEELPEVTATDPQLEQQYAVHLYEEYFTNYSYSPEYTKVYENGCERQYYSIPIGLLKANRAIGRAYDWGYISSATAMKLVGWIDPEVFLDTGIDEILQRAWPELYEGVLEGKMTPFEALLKTGWVEPEVYEALTNNGKMQEAVEKQVEQVDESDEELLEELEYL